MSTYNAQKAVTLDRLQQLHGALLTCPKEEDTEKDPKGLKVTLMPHQNRALAWLMFRYSFFISIYGIIKLFFFFFSEKKKNLPEAF